jgi:SAM-dependent methyltransferase
MESSIAGPGHNFNHPRYWRNHWQQKKHALFSTHGLESAGKYWNNRKNVTDLYVKSRTREAWQGNVNVQLKAMNIPDGARVLDIGGGTGTHAIPLATQGCDVTVVEPSVAMREELHKNLSSSGAGPLKVIPFRWEDIPLGDLGGPFDIVIASYSLSMMDIEEAIKKMQGCCRGTIHLFWFLTPPTWARVSRDLWPLIHGRTYPGEPLADCLWQALLEMGIHANFIAERKKKSAVYQTVDEAVREYYLRLNCSSAEQKDILNAYFSEELRSNGEGFVLRGDSYGAHIWWNNGIMEQTTR